MAAGEIPTLSQRLVALDGLIARNKKWMEGNSTFAVAWPTEQATLHRMTLPFTDRAQIERTLPFAVEAEVPFELSEMVIGWRVLAAQDEAKLLVALVKKEGLKALIGALAQRKMDPRHVFLDVDVLSHYSPKDTVSAVLHIGYGNTVVAVSKEGIVQWSRAINVGGRDFTRAIRDSLGVSWEEAENIKIGNGQDSAATWERMPPAARQALDPVMGLLLAEVRSSLIYAEDAVGEEIDEVRLFGADALLHPLLGYFREDLGVPVEFAVDPNGDAVPATFAVSDGLAARLAGQTKGEEIELRIGDLAFKGGTNLGRALLIGGGLALAAVTMLVMMKSAWDYRGWMVEENAAEERLSAAYLQIEPSGNAEMAVKSPSITVSTLREKLEDTQRRAKIFDRENRTSETVSTLRALTDAFPAPGEVTVNVSELTATSEGITFTAVTDGFQSASDVETSLKQVEQFKTATKSNEKKNKDNVSFTITISKEVAPVAEEG